MRARRIVEDREGGAGSAGAQGEGPQAPTGPWGLEARRPQRVWSWGAGEALHVPAHVAHSQEGVRLRQGRRERPGRCEDGLAEVSLRDRQTGIQNYGHWRED